ncbi:uncharacterized protein LOC143895834 isoform X4 [Temnothorax americanus]|uniref:uncharacterized protein LOC143895834 isoform X4 n=1 Tax=Temnothorax americanus TaxID=1964332 RepID=UPI0040682C9A
MDYGDNKSAKSRHIKSNSDDTVSPNLSKNFVTQVTKRKSIDDKRPFRGDSVNGQRLDSFESTVSPPKKRIKILQNVSVKPTIDFRKPREEVLRFMEELNELAKSKEKLANELYCQEYQLYLQREAKSSASDENDLRANIKSLIVKLEDTHKMYIKIENEYKTYLNEAGTINYNATEDNEKKNLELALFFLKEWKMKKGCNKYSKKLWKCNSFRKKLKSCSRSSSRSSSNRGSSNWSSSNRSSNWSSSRCSSS